MPFQERRKLLLTRGMNSPAKTQNSLRVEMICFLFTRAFDARSNYWLIFLSRSFIYYTGKMNYSVYSKNRAQECCLLATSGHKGTKSWKKSIIFPRRNSNNLLLALVQTVKRKHISFICPSLTALRWDIFQEYSKTYRNSANFAHFCQKNSRIQWDSNKFRGVL